MLTPIETEYKGYRFRSRLEARWAVFFDHMGIAWDYEREGFDLGPLGWYLPDFYLPPFDCWAEVKPTQFTEEEFAKSSQLTGGCLLLDGMPFESRGYWLVSPGSDWEETRHYGEYQAGATFWQVHLPVSIYKRRLWFLFGEDPAAYDTLGQGHAEKAAKAARFEFGESGYSPLPAPWPLEEWGEVVVDELPY